MTNDEVRQFQFAYFYSFLMNCGMALVCKFVKVPPEWWVLMAGIGICSGVFGGCVVLIRGYMPKDKPDWDNFAVYCHKHAKEKGEI